MNRTFLGFLGLVLLAAGAFAIATYSDVLTVVDRDAVLTPGTAMPPTWVLYVIAAAAIVVGLLALRWLLAQLTPTTPVQTWRFGGESGDTEFTTSTATAPFVDDVTACSGVHTARAALSGRQDAPRLAVVVSIEQDAAVPAIREYVTTHALPRLRQALDLETLPTTVEFRFTARSGTRVR